MPGWLGGKVLVRHGAVPEQAQVSGRAMAATLASPCPAPAGAGRPGGQMSRWSRRRPRSSHAPRALRFATVTQTAPCVGTRTPVVLAEFLPLPSKFALRVVGAANLGARGSFPVRAQNRKSFCPRPREGVGKV